MFKASSFTAFESVDVELYYLSPPLSPPMPFMSLKKISIMKYMNREHSFVSDFKHLICFCSYIHELYVSYSYVTYKKNNKRINISCLT